jgi:glucose/arabinose dehydrogenase
MGRCERCGGKQHDPSCPNAEKPLFSGDAKHGGMIVVHSDGSLYVSAGDDYYDFELDADDARKLAEVILARTK